MKDYLDQLARIREAFNKDFERFQSFRDDSRNVLSLSAEEAEQLLKELEALEIKYTGRKSDFVALQKTISKYPSNMRPAIGKANADLKTAFNKVFGVKSIIWTNEIIKRKEQDEGVQEKIEPINPLPELLREQIIRWKIQRETVDVTIPGRRPRRGHLHPITILRQKIEDIFVSMGYAIEDDREIETDYYNFDALNIPPGHPARESQDTFYTTEGFALRSQTSTVQIRAMERRGVPIRIIAPGKVFRRDTPDMTHVPMFHQIEGLCVDKGITMADLKGTVGEWLRRLFGEDTKTRFRPSYFPFTEPSAEFDFSCFKCHGSGQFEGERCRPCKGSGWIELGGSGMVHPNVLKGCGVDPAVFSGFAFGFGLERMCALMYSLDDIRLMFDNDVRFLEQFR